MAILTKNNKVILVNGSAINVSTGPHNILDDIGYNDNKRCRTSGYTLSDAQGYCAFNEYNFDSLSSTDVIRIYFPNGLPTSQDSNIAVQIVDDNDGNFAGGYLYNGRFDTFGVAFNNVSYNSSTKILTLSGHYSYTRTKFRLSAQGLGADFIMTLNEEIN